MALNLLIAILSEPFANVYATMNANHCRTKVDILLEISGLKCCFKKSGKHKFMHFAIYSSEKFNDCSSNDELPTEVKAMSNELRSLKSTVGNMSDHIGTMNEHILEMRMQMSCLIKKKEGNVE